MVLSGVAAVVTLNDERNADLERIRRTYEDYRRDDRYRLWDAGNRGYARIARDRDRALVNLISRSLPTGGTVLDLGCGPGDLAEAARAVIGEIAWTGVDLLPEAVEAAKRSRPWASWIEASADRLPFSDGSFDLVVAATLFSSLPSPRLEAAAALEIARVLKPGGWLIWYDLRYGNPVNRSVHGLGQNAVRRLFPGWRAELRPVTLIPPLARRLGPLTGVLYGPLERLPILRSHLVGRLRHP